VCLPYWKVLVIFATGDVLGEMLSSNGPWATLAADG
jgi:hypothetical protein